MDCQAVMVPNFKNSQPLARLPITDKPTCRTLANWLLIIVPNSHPAKAEAKTKPASFNLDNEPLATLAATDVPYREVVNNALAPDADKWAVATLAEAPANNADADDKAVDARVTPA